MNLSSTKFLSRFIKDGIYLIVTNFFQFFSVSIFVFFFFSFQTFRECNGIIPANRNFTILREYCKLIGLEANISDGK